jgi:DNA-directed RNA polymerase specialized sigma subunit
VVKTLKMPFKANQVDPRAAEVLARIAEATESLKAAEATRKDLVAERARLIKRARKYGVSLDRIAETMGVSRARVQQIEAGK